jgi:DNA-binding NtrC family response regulator
MANILVVDDDKSIVDSFRALFKGKHHVLASYNAREALDSIRENEIELVFLDYRLPGQDGLKVLESIRKLEPGLYVIVITGHGSFETIIQAMSLGAYDYIEKPLDIDKITILTRRALETRKMNAIVKVVTEEQAEFYSLNRIVGKSQVMQDIFKQIGLLVNNDVTVLISGESGSGKELIAKSLHYNSPRKNEPFMAVNCSGLTESLLDNELFGHEPQAFTGATSQKKGKVEAAGEGTLFLDEIGDMPLPIQAKLLRVLQEKEFQRLGGVRNIAMRARVIVASNKTLREEVAAGRFRKDLFYRINVASLSVPPLRDRKDDILLLSEHFIKEANRRLKKSVTGLLPETMEILTGYSWPGNVRELENVIINMCINTPTPALQPAIIPRYISHCGEVSDIFSDFIENFLEKNSAEKNLLPLLVSELEKHLILLVGKRLQYNKSAMAAALGISRVTLQKKMAGLEKM